MSLNPNFIPDEVLDWLEDLPMGFIDKTPEELEAAFNYDTLVRKIRVAFWVEYEYAVSKLHRLKMSSVARRVGMAPKHLERVFKVHENLAYITLPIESYDNFLDEALSHGLKRVREELLNIPIKYIDKHGNEAYNVKAAELLLRTVAFLDLRKHGAPKQKIENVNINGRPKEFKDLIDTTNLEAIDKRIAQLEMQGVTTEAAHAILSSGRQVPTAGDLEDDVSETPSMKSLDYNAVARINVGRHSDDNDDDAFEV